MARFVVALASLGLLLGACGWVHATSYTATVENLTDDLLAGLEAYALENNLTAVVLPDVALDFSNTFLFFTVAGKLNLTIGSVTNFKKINRLNTSKLVFLDNSHGLFLQTSVKIPELKGSYDFSVNVGNIRQKGQLELTVAGLSASAILHVPTDTIKPALEELKINNLGNIGINIKDGVLGWVATIVANVVTLFIRGPVVKALESQLPALVNALLDSVDFPALLRPPADLLA